MFTNRHIQEFLQQYYFIIALNWKKFPSILNDMFTIGIPQSNENYNKAMPHFTALCFIVFHRYFVSYFTNGRFVVTSRQTSQQMPFFSNNICLQCVSVSRLVIPTVFQTCSLLSYLWKSSGISDYDSLKAQMMESIF